MMLPTPEPAPLPLTENWPALKDAIKRFEQSWRQGPRPVIDDFLPADDSLRSRVLIELVHIDLELRLKAGEAARVEEYLTRYPKLADDRAVPLGLIAAEYDLRRRSERGLSLDDYVKRFPQYHAELAELISPGTINVRDELPHLTESRPDGLPQIPGYEVL